MVELGLLMIFFLFVELRVLVNQTNESFVVVVLKSFMGLFARWFIPLLDSDDANLGETCAF